MRTTEFAPAAPEAQEQPAPSSGSAPPTLASSWKAGRLSGHDFALQPDGTLRCPASQTLRVHERRKEADGSLRMVYAANIHSCRPCPLREQCQWNGKATSKPRQVSVRLHPLVVGSSALLWRDWSRREHRRTCMELVRDQHLEVRLAEDSKSQSRPTPSPAIFSRAQRAHFRLSWTERLTRHARGQAEGQISIKLFGVPDHCADFLGLRASSPVTRLRAMGILSSDRQASPNGASWLLASALLQFLSSVTRTSSFTAFSLSSLGGQISLEAASTLSLRPSLNHHLVAQPVGL
jgi:hypothetical protein